ncbi:MAG: FkbM family methyltransferase [Phycisphaerae bacterium]
MHTQLKSADPLNSQQAAASAQGRYVPARSSATVLPREQKPETVGPVGRMMAAMVAVGFSRAYRWLGWRPTDRTFSRLGRRFRSLRHMRVSMNDGRTLYLDLRNPVAIPYLLEGEFPAERTEAELVTVLVEEGDLAVDIGANVGWYASLLCRQVGRGGQVHAFEPNPYLTRLLQSLAGEHPQLTVHRAALGDCAGKTDFYIPHNWISGSCRPSNGSARQFTVPMARLDQVLPRRPDFVKLDAEGAEMDILAGGRSVLDAPDAPTWLVELSTEEARTFGHEVEDLVDAFARATRARYTAYCIDSDHSRLRPLELPDTDDYWMNALFVPAARADRLPPRWLA